MRRSRRLSRVRSTFSHSFSSVDCSHRRSGPHGMHWLTRRPARGHSTVLRTHTCSQANAALQSVTAAQPPLKSTRHSLAHLHQHHALPVGGVPHIGQVVDALAPLVDEQRRRLAVCRLDPVGEQVPLVRLVPQVLQWGQGRAGQDRQERSSDDHRAAQAWASTTRHWTAARFWVPASAKRPQDVPASGAQA